MAEIRALSVYVYRSSELGDCTNHGVSSKHNTLYVACPSGPDLIDEDDPRLLKVVKREFVGRTVFHAEPYKPCPKGCVGWMSGGNFVATCDSRFGDITEGFYGALDLHDRCETKEQYDMYWD